MSVITPNETALNWQANRRERGLHIYLSGPDGEAPELITGRVAGLPVSLSIVPTTDWINPDDLASAQVAVVQVDPDSAASIKRFEKLAAVVETPLIAASFDPPLSLVRSLMRCGAHDVLPLPLTFEDLEAAILPLAADLEAKSEAAIASSAKLVTVVKSVGGVGATALVSQLALRAAEKEAVYGRDVCLLDLDVQFGDVAFQLGLRPKLSLTQLLDSGARLDGDLLRATVTEHPSGLKVISAPADMMPLEGVPSDQVLRIVELATREFGTVFVDLPANWTNWSLSLVARSDLVLLVTELTVASLHRARRQLDLLHSQDLNELDVRVVMNRYDKSLAKTVSMAAANKALGRPVVYTVANDFAVMRAAIDRGLSIDAVKRKTALGKDLDALDAGVAVALGLER
jgi:pilus assembly protein CpaE